MRRNIAPAEIPALIDALAPWFPVDAMEREVGRLGVKLLWEPLKLKRSVDQNSRYWSIVTAIGEEIGDTKEGVHEDLLCEFHGAEEYEHPITGEVKRRPRRRSSTLNTTEFGDLMALAERWAAMCGARWEEAA